MTRQITTTAVADVAAPPDEVWDLVSDLERYAEWVHGTLEVLDADPIARVGAVYAERNRIAGPLAARSEWTVVTLDRERGRQRHESSGSPPIRSFAVVVEITPSADGTRFLLRLEADVAAGPFTRPLAWLLGRSLASSNRRSVRNLVDLAEREHRAAAGADRPATG